MDKIYRAALYLRLSRDDEGAGESSSIGNQRAMLLAYAGEHGYRVTAEYVDDGYSGTSFDRPGFRSMLAAIENGKINLVLTKDLSRLGRDYIQTGQYTEVYFPSKQVRCIAVNDGYDTDGPYTDIAPFKNVVNEMYARDASRKIRSALLAKRQSGDYIGNFAPYGYRKDPLDKNHLIPDEHPAAVVKDIFALAADGKRPGDIARMLNERGELSPALYRCTQHPQLARPAGGIWTAAAVGRLLKNVAYLGHMAQGKTTKASLKSARTLRIAPSGWTVVSNTHEALIPSALFERAKRRMEGRACPAEGRFFNRFSGIARCADCGRGMSSVGSRKNGSPIDLACGGYKLRGAAACSNHFIRYHSLCAIVSDAVRRQLALTCEEKEALLTELQEALAQNAPRHGPCEQEQLRLEQAKIDRVIGRLYEDCDLGKLNGEQFDRLLQTYRARSDALRLRQASLDAARPVNEAEAALDAARGFLDRLCSAAELDTDVLFALIDRIEIGQGSYQNTEHGKCKRQTIRLIFRFATETGSMEYGLDKGHCVAYTSSI